MLSAPAADAPRPPPVAGAASAANPAFAADMLAAPARTRLVSEAAATWLGDSGTLPAGPASPRPGGTRSSSAPAWQGGTADRVTIAADASRFEAAAVSAVGPLLAATPSPSASAYAWGDNTYGQLGTSSGSNRLPSLVSNVPGTFTNSSISGVAAGASHSLALQNGAVFSWGNDTQGQLGNNSTAQRNVPGNVSSANGFINSGVTAVAAGAYHSLALQNGVIYAWGDDTYGELGNNSTAQSNVPVKVSSPLGIFSNSSVTAVAAGQSHSLALQNGNVYTWGDNSYGQLGNNSTAQRNVPGNVSSANGFINSGVTAVAAGAYHSLALQNGVIYAWGDDTYGELGNNSTAQSNVPVKVSDFTTTLVSGGPRSIFINTGVTAVAAGLSHSLALQNGNVFAWGDNTYGQLGNNSTSSSNKPLEVTFSNNNLGGIVQVAAGEFSSYALSSDGSLYVWATTPTASSAMGPPK